MYRVSTLFLPALVAVVFVLNGCGSDLPTSPIPRGDDVMNQSPPGFSVSSDPIADGPGDGDKRDDPPEDKKPTTWGKLKVKYQDPEEDPPPNKKKE